jgi:hypothetical protein
MKEVLFVFRTDYTAIPTDSPEEMQVLTKKWMDWIGSVAAQNKLVETGKRLNSDGKVVRPNGVVTDGPYTEIKETIGGYMFVKVETLEEAIEIAKGCPILTIGGNVELREIAQS